MDVSDLGKHFIIGLSGPTLSGVDRDALKDIRPSGVILRAHNFEQSLPYNMWLRSLSELIEAVKKEAGRENPIIALDHEGGRVHRVPAPLTHFPEACRYARCASEVAKAMAIELASIGINLSFSPVADIHSNPANPVIGLRSFGSTPAEVASAVVSFGKALLANRVVPVVKHFPGHGDTSQDSHEELPLLSLSLEALRGREIIPFKAAVEAGLPAILTAHVRFPAIDSLPATLSKPILSGVLRTELGFGGVIITDDLDMKAITTHFSNETVAVKSIEAGCDMLLFNHDQQRAAQVRDIILKALESKQISPELVRQSHLRVENFLSHILPMNHSAELAADILSQHASLNLSLRV